MDSANTRFGRRVYAGVAEGECLCLVLTQRKRNCKLLLENLIQGKRVEKYLDITGRNIP